MPAKIAFIVFSVFVTLGGPLKVLAVEKLPDPAHFINACETVMTEMALMKSPIVQSGNIKSALKAAESNIKIYKDYFTAARSHLLEREYIVDLGELALLAEEHLIMMGPPGNAKSMSANIVLGNIFDEASGDPSYFTMPLTSETTLSDILGFPDFKEMSTGSGRVSRFYDEGALGSRNVFFDEIFDVRKNALRLLLGILNERSHGKHKGVTETVFAASNSYLADVYTTHDNPQAVVDRFALAAFVPSDFEFMQSYRDLIQGAGGKNVVMPKFTFNQLEAFRDLVAQVEIPNHVAELLMLFHYSTKPEIEAIEAAAEKDYQDKLRDGETPLPPWKSTRYYSKRTLYKAAKILKALVVRDWILSDGKRSLIASIDDLKKLEVFYTLNGPEDSFLETLLKRASNPKEIDQLQTIRKERDLFRETLSDLVEKFNDVVGQVDIQEIYMAADSFENMTTNEQAQFLNRLFVMYDQYKDVVVGAEDSTVEDVGKNALKQALVELVSGLSGQEVTQRALQQWKIDFEKEQTREREEKEAAEKAKEAARARLAEKAARAKAKLEEDERRSAEQNKSEKAEGTHRIGQSDLEKNWQRLYQVMGPPNQGELPEESQWAHKVYISNRVWDHQNHWNLVENGELTWGDRDTFILGPPISPKDLGANSIFRFPWGRSVLSRSPNTYLNRSSQRHLIVDTDGAVATVKYLDEVHGLRSWSGDLVYPEGTPLIRPLFVFMSENEVYLISPDFSEAFRGTYDLDSDQKILLKKLEIESDISLEEWIEHFHRDGKLSATMYTVQKNLVVAENKMGDGIPEKSPLIVNIDYSSDTKLKIVTKNSSTLLAETSNKSIFGPYDVVKDGSALLYIQKELSSEGGSVWSLDERTTDYDSFGLKVLQFDGDPIHVSDSILLEDEGILLVGTYALGLVAFDVKTGANLGQGLLGTHPGSGIEKVEKIMVAHNGLYLVGFNSKSNGTYHILRALKDLPSSLPEFLSSNQSSKEIFSELRSNELSNDLSEAEKEILRRYSATAYSAYSWTKSEIVELQSMFISLMGSFKGTVGSLIEKYGHRYGHEWVKLNQEPGSSEPTLFRTDLFSELNHQVLGDGLKIVNYGRHRSLIVPPDQLALEGVSNNKLILGLVDSEQEQTGQGVPRTKFLAVPKGALNGDSIFAVAPTENKDVAVAISVKGNFYEIRGEFQFRDQMEVGSVDVWNYSFGENNESYTSKEDLERRLFPDPSHTNVYSINNDKEFPFILLENVVLGDYLLFNSRKAKLFELDLNTDSERTRFVLDINEESGSIVIIDAEPLSDENHFIRWFNPEESLIPVKELELSFSEDIGMIKSGFVNSQLNQAFLLTEKLGLIVVDLKSGQMLFSNLFVDEYGEGVIEGVIKISEDSYGLIVYDPTDSVRKFFVYRRVEQ